MATLCQKVGSFLKQQVCILEKQRKQTKLQKASIYILGTALCQLQIEFSIFVVPCSRFSVPDLKVFTMIVHLRMHLLVRFTVSTFQRRCKQQKFDQTTRQFMNSGPLQTSNLARWWFQPSHLKICSSNWIISLGFREKS